MTSVAYHLTPPDEHDEDRLDAMAWWLKPPRKDSVGWRERCEEHICFSSYDDTNIRVIGQMRLPPDEAAGLDAGDSQRLYLIPYFWLGKAQPRTSPYEVRGPDGRVVPTHTRAHNTKLTVDAFEHFAHRTLKASDGLVRDHAEGSLRSAGGSPAQIPLRSLLYRLTVGRDIQASTSLRLIVEQLARENGGGELDCGHLPKGRCLHPKPGVTEQDLRNFELLLRDIAAGELLWVPLLGCPGSEVRLELTYTTRASKLALFRRRSPRRIVTAYETRLSQSGSHEESPVPHRLIAREPLKEDDRRDRTTTRRLWNRLAHLFGYAPYETIFGASAMHRWSSYHLHVESPPGVEIRAAQLLTRLSWPKGEPAGHVRSELSAERAHLVVSRAQLTEQAALRKPMPVRIRIRTAERHTTYFAAGMALLVAAMLWTLSRASLEVVTKNASAINEILVIVPALLLIFAARPGEHGMASRVLAGVRGLVLLSGACCVASAVVLSDGAWHTLAQLRGTLMAIAGLASVIAGLLTLNVLLSIRALDGWRLRIDRRFDDSRWEEKERRGAGLQLDRYEPAARATPHKGSHDYQNLATALWLAQIGITFWLWLTPELFSGRHVAELVLVSLGLLLVALPSGVLAARGEATRTTRPPGMAGVLGCTAILTVAAVVLAAVNQIFGFRLPAVTRWPFPAAIFALPFLFQLFAPLPWLRREKDNDMDQPGYDYIVASAEGDHEETSELIDLLDVLTRAIVNPRAAFRLRLRERLGIVKPPHETVFVDVAPDGHCRR